MYMISNSVITIRDLQGKFDPVINSNKGFCLLSVGNSTNNTCDNLKIDNLKIIQTSRTVMEAYMVCLTFYQCL